MVPRANLRAFEPLDAFPPGERERWRAYVSTGSGISRREAVATEDHATATRLITGRGHHWRDDLALVRRAGKRVLICPLQLELRAAVALEDFRLTVPDEIVDAFVPAPAFHGLHHVPATGRPPHILDAPLAVPLSWFVAFSPDERHVTDPPEGRGPRVTYLTLAAQAELRLARAIGIVEARIEDGEDVLAELAEVAAWVDAFHRESVVELDYAGVAAQFSAAELAQDTTCDDVWKALDALGSGDLLAATAYYGVARSRWTHMRAKEHAN